MTLRPTIIYSAVFYLIIMITKPLAAQTDTIPLSQVEISSSATPVVFRQVSRSIRVITSDELASAPVLSLDDILRFYGGVDVRERGGLGVQSDLSIRGGGMDQNLLMYNGVGINDPQTGHHNTNQAIMMFNVDKIEILEGPGARWFGSNAFSGGINLITELPENNRLGFDVSGGEFGLFFADLSAAFRSGNWVNSTSVSRHKSDGYTSNTDFSVWQINNESTYKLSNGMLRLYLGYLDKGFGANSFYTAKYPDQYEQIKSSLASLSLEKGARYPLKANVSWRRLYDRFELFREDDRWYQKQGDVYVNGADTAGFPTASGLYPYKGHNYHRTDVVTGNLSVGMTSIAGRSQLGMEARYEGIISNVLGDPMTDTLYASRGDAWYNHRKDRQSLTFFLNHSFERGRFSLAGGISAYYNSEFDWHFSPGLDVGYFVVDWLKVYGSVNQAFRIPTFTDLYYQGADQVSNPNLQPETATTYEMGSKAFFDEITLSAAVFHRDGQNLIDWVKETPGEKWHSMNLTSMKTNGISGSVQYLAPLSLHRLIRSAGVSYTYLQSDKSSASYFSLYALDYLQHNLVITCTHGLWVKNLSVAWAYNFQQRNGSYIDFNSGDPKAYQPVNRINVKVTFQYRWASFYVMCRNLLNDKAVDYGNIPPAGLWVTAGVTGKLDFSRK